MLLGCLDSKGHLLAGFLCGVFCGSLFACLGFCWFSGFFFLLFNTECLYELRSLFAVIHVFAGCVWIYIWILVYVSNVS